MKIFGKGSEKQWISGVVGWERVEYNNNVVG
jgi:hypothetical protein